jgi:hypothetical protein
MVVYRVHIVDEDGQIVGPPISLDCENDDEAINRAKQLKGGRAREVWRKARRVAKIVPER